MPHLCGTSKSMDYCFFKSHRHFRLFQEILHSYKTLLLNGSVQKSTKGTFTELPESRPAFARCSLIILLLYNMSRENLSWSSQECELSIILRIFQKIQTTTTVAEKKNEFLFILVHVHRVHTYVCTSTMYLLENVWNLVNCIHFYSYWSVYVDRL